MGGRSRSITSAKRRFILPSRWWVICIVGLIVFPAAAICCSRGSAEESNQKESFIGVVSLNHSLILLTPLIAVLKMCFTGIWSHAESSCREAV